MFLGTASIPVGVARVVPSLRANPDGDSGKIQRFLLRR